MQPVDPSARRYDGLTMTLHWLTALLVAEQWVGAHLIDDFSGFGRILARSVHISFGVVLAALLVWRLSWRGSAGRRLPAADHGLLQVAARATHWALYVLVVGTVLLGITNVWVRGDSIFGLFRIPSFAPGDRDLRRAIDGYHALAANAVLVVAGVHAAAALVHQFLWRDGVLMRMLPFGGRG
jgi:cytochrome b561